MRKFKIGDKVFCKDGYEEFTGWIASIEDRRPYSYNIVKEMKHIGKSFRELRDEYDSEFQVFELESLTLLEDNPC